MPLSKLKGWIILSSFLNLIGSFWSYAPLLSSITAYSISWRRGMRDRFPGVIQHYLETSTGRGERSMNGTINHL